MEEGAVGTALLVEEDCVADTFQHRPQHPDSAGVCRPAVQHPGAVAEGVELGVEQSFPELLQVLATVHGERQGIPPRHPHPRVLHRTQVRFHGFFFHKLIGFNC